ncbi:hypothetical protein EDB83DRAFT_2555109 [Lactarius deliciosus]|nr:hypothetical protein EDB83DRAFT_2555109 [Lactarius deliciosus]
MATPDIIFYTAKVEIAFQEAKADVTRYSIDLRNKPEIPNDTPRESTQQTRVSPATSAAFFFHGESPDAFIATVAEIQELLPPAAQFAVGDHFTITDAAIAPFLVRWELQLRNDVLTMSTSLRRESARVYILVAVRKYFG